VLQGCSNLEEVVLHVMPQGSFFGHLNFFGMLHSTNIGIHTHMSTHPYEYMHVHPTPMSTSERLGQLDLEIYEVGQSASCY
jgi:hypothetical protein